MICIIAGFNWAATVWIVSFCLACIFPKTNSRSVVFSCISFLIDIDSDLMGITRKNSKCSEDYYVPNQNKLHYRELAEFESNIIDIIFSKEFSGNSDSIRLRNIKNLIIRKGSETSMIAPVDGYSTEGLNIDTNHNGVDIVSKKGDLIKCAQDGLVIFSGFNDDSGNTVIISHPFNSIKISK